MRKVLILLIIISFIVACSNKNLHYNLSHDKDILITDKIINEKIDFTRLKKHYTNLGLVQTEVKSNITFVNCTFKDTILGFKTENKKILSTKFENDISFINCRFEKPIIFRQSEFKGQVRFYKDTFYNNVSFEGNIFFDKVFFQENTFKGAAKFTNSIFEQNTNFMDCQFDSLASFDNTIFEKNVNFSNGKFYGYTNFYNTKTNDFSINYSKFYDRVYFNNSIFNGKAQFVKIEVIKDFGMKDIIFRGKAQITDPVFHKKNKLENLIFFIFPEITLSDSIELKNVKILQTKEYKL